MSVICLAQSSRFRDFPDDADDVVAVNVQLPLMLLRYALDQRAGSFIYASTGGVYPLSEQPCSETQQIDAMRPVSFYAASKLASEILLAPYASLIPTVILRPFFIYGPSQPPQMLMPRLIQSIKDGREVVLRGTDGMRLNPIHVADACRAVRAALALGRSDTINIAGPEITSIRQICEAAAEHIGRAPLFRMEAPVGPQSLIASTDRMVGTLVQPMIGLRAGLRSMISPSTEIIN